MRSRLFLSLIAASALIAGSAQAGDLISATWSQSLQGIDITLTGTDTNGDGTTDVGSGLCTDTLTTHTQQTIICPASLTASGSSTATSYSASFSLPLFSLSQFTTGGTINIFTMATVSGGASLAGSNSNATGFGFGVPGAVTVKVAAHVVKGANASMLEPGMTTLVKLPLSVGKAGVETGYFFVLTSIHYITVDFYAWTPHTLTFTGLTTKMAALPTVTAMGSFALTGGGGGQVTLVAPSKISIDGPLAQRRTAGFTALTLTFAPEPSTLLLLGAGVAGLVLVGTRKR
jgi:hypothetical protein